MPISRALQARLQQYQRLVALAGTSARQQHRGVVVRDISECYAGADALVHRQRFLEMLLRLRPARHYGAEQPEIAIGRSAAGNASTQRNIAPGIRQ
jgi:hypothetical protein